jgi:endonuclease YncB( thermonuclease family)
MRFAFPLLLSLLAWPAWAGVIEGRVIEVPDGDTITVLASQGTSIHRVRLAGIDAPALSSPYGGSARESLKRIARGKTVRVDTAAMDSKGRLVGIVQVFRDPKDCGNAPCEERLDPGLTQLASGMAGLDKANLAYHSDEAQRRYAFAEAHARTNKLGLWRVPTPARTMVRMEVR